MSATLGTPGGATLDLRLGRSLRILGVATQYELRKASAFRMGFLLREVFRGVDRGLVMSFVYVATFRSSGSATLRGWTLHQVIEYLVLATIAGKLVFHDRALDLSEQIFEGYVTKFVVMPVRYFTLVLARFLQFMAVQGSVAAVLATIGAILLSRWWPHPGAERVAMALVLVVLGSYCFLLAYFTLHSLAFWLDVVWTLLGMVRMTCGFVMGELVPISLMPHAVEAVFRCLFPYWTLCGPLEIALGRQDASDFTRGLLVLLAWIVALQWLSAFTWKRGLRRYAGSGA